MRSVSVVIPHYGDAGPTLALAAALRAQEFPGWFEVIVADDASPMPFPETDGVTVVRRAVNGGFGTTVNAGVAVATGDLVLILNSDVEIGSTLLADLVEVSERFPRSVLGPRVLDHGVPQVTTWKWPRVYGLVAEWLVPLARFHDREWLGRFWGADHDAFNASQVTATDWLVGACLLLPRAEFEAVGGFDESFFMNCEEIDLQRRLRSRGVVARYVPQVSLHHESGGSSDPERKSGWLVDARFHFHHKWGGAHRLAAGLLAASVVNLAWNAGRRVRGSEVDPAAVFATQVRAVLHGWRRRAYDHDTEASKEGR